MKSFLSLDKFAIPIYNSEAGCAKNGRTKQFSCVRNTSDGILAQLGEHLPYKQRVTGSSPVGPIVLQDYGGIAQLARAYGSYP